eukprot:CAMPEP_0177685470 /NCGR_PEP_ID=MMETSP0447-20121125/33054_1 /TAXON_ID=0 /ORGANISM="Stygamoeba regulata, Strain BSH-02190019" /LENGTH=269 /DNA_ID=CAMNT_0019195531 /DNA_START=99 /DNA_END=905 /DNA_ORIENTATION=-
MCPTPPVAIAAAAATGVDATTAATARATRRPTRPFSEMPSTAPRVVVGSASGPPGVLVASLNLNRGPPPPRPARPTSDARPTGPLTPPRIPPRPAPPSSSQSSGASPPLTPPRVAPRLASQPGRPTSAMQAPREGGAFSPRGQSVIHQALSAEALPIGLPPSPRRQNTATGAEISSHSPRTLEASPRRRQNTTGISGDVSTLPPPGLGITANTIRGGSSGGDSTPASPVSLPPPRPRRTRTPSDAKPQDEQPRSLLNPSVGGDLPMGRR